MRELLKNITKFLSVALLFDIVLSLVSLFNNFQYYSFYGLYTNARWSDGKLADFIPDELERMREIVSSSQAVWTVIWFILFLVWVEKAHRNTRILGARELKYSDAACAWWYLVPVANVIMPFLTMTEIWKASASPAEWKTQPNSFLVVLYWIFWLGSTSIMVIGVLNYMLGSSVKDYMVTELFFIVADIAYILGAILLILLINKIERMQFSHIK